MEAGAVLADLVAGLTLAALADPTRRAIVERLMVQGDLSVGELGKPFVDYLLKIKDAEVARFLSEVTDWEHREYFEMF